MRVLRPLEPKSCIYMKLLLLLSAVLQWRWEEAKFCPFYTCDTCKTDVISKHVLSTQSFYHFIVVLHCQWMNCQSFFLICSVVLAWWGYIVWALKILKKQVGWLKWPQLIPFLPDCFVTQVAVKYLSSHNCSKYGNNIFRNSATHYWGWVYEF